MAPETVTQSEQFVLQEWTGSSSSKLSITAIISSTPSISVTSVTPDYVPFQIWDSLQGLSTYIRMMLSTQALLSAIGVGEKSATVIGATFQWFLRDLSGMLGGILFTFYQGSNLDSDAKMWRLVADLMNDLGNILIPFSVFDFALHPKWNVDGSYLSSISVSICIHTLPRKSLTVIYDTHFSNPSHPAGVASGATRAALTQHFALQQNAADISAKEGSQETVATMAGMAVGMFLAHVTRGHALVIWFCFLSLTMFHMYGEFLLYVCYVCLLKSIWLSLLLYHIFPSNFLISYLFRISVNSLNRHCFLL
ncbi:hypothetical protein KSS87_000125 [Heliosperma pusillum]|nr:hypothetical protein KSS87_000125 [Heliosperma pusillum]